MNSLKHKHYLISKSLLPLLMLSLMMVLSANTGYATNTNNIAQAPLFLTTSATPVIMLNISKDHQLYFKAYDDYSDLDNDGFPDTTYKNSIDYYGYFDSYKCYSYVNSEFEPSSTTTTKYCSGLWSGNFLNWASMARIDTIRKILYGGLRSTDLDTTSTTSSTTTPVVTTTITHPVTTAGPTPTTAAVAATGPTVSSSTLSSSTSCPSLPPDTNNVLTTALTGPTTTYSIPSSTSSTANDPGFPATTVNGSTTTTNNSSTNTALTYPDVNGHHAQTTTVSTSTPISTTTTYTKAAAPTTGSNVTQPDGYCYKHTSSGGTITYRLNINSSTSTAATTTTTTTTIVTTATQTLTKTTSTTTTVTNTGGVTVLERSYIPNDAHSFAKFYNGTDLNQLTPYTSSTGITLCNTTKSGTTLSQNVTDAPLIRVAMGDFSLWSANERWQCRWNEEINSHASGQGNGNVTATSGLSASAYSPSNASSGSGDFNARVKVCVTGLINSENCKVYPNGTVKPIGLLQTYGDTDLIHFGLMTGSYGKNKSGGVLRKNVSSMTNEINVTTNGTFNSAPFTGGIINTLNLLRIYGYCHSDGTYFCTTGADNCSWGLTSFTDGNCSNWGNPQSEIFLESLRYLSNHSALNAYLPTSPNTDSSYISGLTVATSPAPSSPVIPANQWCAKLNVIQFNASTSSYDGDQLSNVADISATPMNLLTDTVGVGENIPGHSYFVGALVGGTGTNSNQLCTAKTVTNLSNVLGTCPDAPRLSGTYQIDGLAQFAHNNDIQQSLQGNQLVTTYGVALSPKVPKIVVPIPSSTSTVTILPACQDSSLPGNCTIVDFKIVSQVCSPVSSTTNCGKIYVNWEDSEQGGDFDMDMWGILTYSVSSTQVNITTDVLYQSTPYLMGFGYILSGTTKDGFHAHSGINGYAYTDPQPGTVTTGVNACANCTSANAATTVSYPIGSSSVLGLQQPLFYAAKWGGFIDSNSNGIPDLQGEWDKNGDGIPDRYFFATNPSALATSLNAAFEDVIKTKGASSTVAANSTQLNTGTQVYQAKFDSGDWSGQLLAYSIDAGTPATTSTPATPATGALTFVWDASAKLSAYGSRNIYTYYPLAAAGSSGVLFQWANLTTTPAGTSQQDYLNQLAGVNDGKGALRVDWLRGDNTHEQTSTNPTGIFRARTNFLGDIINSDPVYVGSQDYGYGALSAEGSSYTAFRASSAYTSRRPMLYAGANDGMLHGFDASSSTTSGGQEIFAYIPNALFPGLSNLTSPNYNHQYYVDGAPVVGDVYYDSAWHTLLAGTTGAGGRAVFALDVTNPNVPGPSIVLWEFTSSNDVDLGYTLAQPSVVRMQDGHWVVIVANGYNSDNGRAVLFVLDAKTGAVLQKIVTPTTAGTTAYPNGLSSPVAVDTNNDHSVDMVYAGDLYGNLWKFDVSGSAGSWPTPTSPFFVACTTTGTSCSATDRQPITGKPNVGPVGATGTDQNGVGNMVYFGTGKYFELVDNIYSSSPQVQTFYGLWDKGTAITDRAMLQNQTIDYEVCATTPCPTGTNPNLRVVSKNPVCYAASSVGCTSSSPLKNGWALNLLDPVNGAEGERMVSFPLVRQGLVLFPTIIPSADPCGGGTSYFMAVDALSGGEFGSVPFNINGNGVIDNNDKVVINGVARFASGIDLEIGIIKTPTVIASPPTSTPTSPSTSTSVAYAYFSGSTGNTAVLNLEDGSGSGSGGGGSGIRRSWRQLK